MKSILFLLICLPLSATIRCVGTAPTGVTCGATYANSAVQTALDAGQPGDTIYLQAGYTYPASVFRVNGSTTNPITVTSNMYAWLPCANCRITPSYIPLLPFFGTTTVNQPSLEGYVDGSGNPPQGWTFVGIGLGVNTGALQQSTIFSTGGNASCPSSGCSPSTGWYISGPSNAPNYITLDRVFAIEQYTDGLGSTFGFEMNGSNVVLKNSFLWPLYANGTIEENHGTWVLTGPGPYLEQNNFISAATIPYFTGGTAPDYPNGIAGSITRQYNYYYRPWKWYPSTWNGSTVCTIGSSGCYYTANPYPQYYIADGLPAPQCVKNLGEYKLINGALQQYNVHENLWIDGGGECNGQWFGQSLTVRSSANLPPAYGGSGNGYWINSPLNTTGTTFTWTSAMNTSYPISAWVQPGNAVASANPVTADNVNYNSGITLFDVRQVETITNEDVTGMTPNTGTINAAFSPNLSSQIDWVWQSENNGLWKNVTIQNEVFRNVASGVNILAKDRYGWSAASTTDALRIAYLTMNNLLFVDTVPNWGHNGSIGLYPQEEATTTDPVGGHDISITHATFDWAPTAYDNLRFILNGIGTSVAALITNVSFRSIIFPETCTGGSCGPYAIYASVAPNGSGRGNNSWDAASYFVTGIMNMDHNQMDYVSTSCSVVNCAGAQTGANSSQVVWEPGTHTVAPSTPMSKAGHDGMDIGVLDGLLPQINNISVTTSANTALLQYDLNAPISDAGNTQPCELEVSPTMTSGSPSVSALDSFVGPTLPGYTELFQSSVSGLGIAYQTAGAAGSYSAQFTGSTYEGDMFMIGVTPSSTISASLCGTPADIGSGTVTSVTVTCTPAAGSTLLLFSGAYGTVTSTVADTTGGNSIVVPSVTNLSGFPNWASSNSSSNVYNAWIVKSATGSASTFTVTYSASAQYASLVVVQMTGTNTTSPVDCGNHNFYNGTYSPSASCTTTHTGDLILGFGNQYAVGGLGIGASPTNNFVMPYTVTNDLNPVYFKQPDESNRTNSKLLPVVVSGSHVFWPIGQNATVTGDDGNSHNLGLSSSTTYYGRLMCYGDTQHLNFTTKSSSSEITSVPMTFGGATSVTVNYGSTTSLGSTVSGSSSVNVPVTAGQFLYYQVVYNGVTGPMQVMLP